MRTKLSVADLRGLTDEPIVAVLATNRADGTTMLSPVWFEWDGAAVTIWSHGWTDGKVRHLQRDPRATVVVAEQTMPLRGFEVTGRASLTTDGFHDTMRRISARYAGEEVADAMVKEYVEPGVLIRIEPTRLRAWDFADDAGDDPTA